MKKRVASQPRLRTSIDVGTLNTSQDLKHRLLSKGLSPNNKLGLKATSSKLFKSAVTLKDKAPQPAPLNRTPSIGRLRPATALKKHTRPGEMRPNTAGIAPQTRAGETRPNTVGFAVQARPVTANFSMTESSMARNMMQRMRKPQGPPALNPAFVQTKRRPEPAPAIEEPPLESVDHFVKKLRQRGNDGSFLYCASKDSSIYDLMKVDSVAHLQKHYTISKNGVSIFEGGEATDFMPLGEWLLERESFMQLKKISFFRKFRLWKVCSMWTRNVNKCYRNGIAEKLKERLFWVNPGYSKVLMAHKAKCNDIERLRFLDLPITCSGITLNEFRQLQAQRQHRLSAQLEEIGNELRTNIDIHIHTIMKILRETQATKLSQSKDNQASSDTVQCELFKKMGLPENMGFAGRALVRNACQRFIRFSYLADFYVMEAQMNLCLSSVSDLLLKLRAMVAEPFDFKAKSVLNPWFAITLALTPTEVPQHERVTEPVYEFVLPPDGTSRPNDYLPGVHTYTTPVRLYGEEPVKLYPGDIRGSHEVVPGLLNLWVSHTPEVADILQFLMDCLINGVDSVQVLQRWSRHPDLEDYVNALEEWDDKVAERWTVADKLYLSPEKWLKHNYLYLNAEAFIEAELIKGYNQIRTIIKELHEPVHSLWETLQIDFEMFQDENLINPPRAFEHSIAKYRWQVEHLKLIPEQVMTRLFVVSQKEIKDSCLRTAHEKERHLCQILPKLLESRLSKVKDWLQSSIVSIPKSLKDIDSFVAEQTAVQEIKLDYQYNGIILHTLQNMHRLAASLKLDVASDIRRILHECGEVYQAIGIKVSISEFNRPNNIAKFQKTVLLMLPQFDLEVEELLNNATDQRYIREETYCVEAKRDLDRFMKQSNELQQKAALLNSYQRSLTLPVSSFENMKKCAYEVEVRYTLWTTYTQWISKTSQWKATRFNEVEAERLQQEADSFKQVAQKCRASLQESTAAASLVNTIDAFRETVFVVVALRGYLGPEHWAMIKTVIGKNFKMGPNFTLGDLLQYEVADKKARIQEISQQAAQERQLRQQLDKMAKDWERQELPVRYYKDFKDIWILDDTEELLLTLDESCTKLNVIAGNRYVSAFREEVDNWKESFNLMQDILDEWLLYQRRWMHLKSIFDSKDIRRHLKVEVQTFQGVDKYFRSLMKKTAQRGLALQATVYADGLLPQLKEKNETLHLLQRQLNKFLETKRRAFPRFYFVSDEDLLSILSNAQDLKLLQPLLRKCFDNLKRFIVVSEERSADIEGMESVEGEKLYFLRLVRAKTSVEDWLNQAQQDMTDTLAKVIAEAHREFEGQSRDAWILEQACQTAATVLQVVWCSETEGAIEAMQADQGALELCLETNEEQLKQLVRLAKTDLDNIQRTSVNGLIVMSVHGRDIVKALRAEEIESLNDYVWQKQLRFYFDKNTEAVSVLQMNARFPYQYEYMGATPRLIITPLTERCWITISSALSIKLGASLMGPAGTGKTESTKDLAKGLGAHCIVFNCSEQITYKMTGQLLSGLAQQGAWSCFDEFNRINLEVLSVVAQQVLSIQNSLREGAADVMLEESLMPLKPSCSIIVTMNPGYTGRAELPDNLKVSFRTVAVMIPDYGMIAEVMLFAEGFSKAKVLSEKLVLLYNLAKEQLSHQPHYDFGMRPIKSILLLAGDLKREGSMPSEAAALLRAIEDSTVPKLVVSDVPLFLHLMKDLFPGSTTQDHVPSMFQQSLELVLTELVLQPQPAFCRKVVHLYDTLCARFGTMIVGPTASGKTTCIQVLADTIEKCYATVCVNRVYPKSISVGELYGEVNLNTLEWRDGLAASLIRAAATDDRENTSKWIVFDGPVDSLWVESMNTVLDDNKMLCLSNGERIKLKEDIKILFEVDDLSFASPATVSRCGMVYMSQEYVGWKAYVQSWIVTSPLEPPQREYTLSLFDEYVKPFMNTRQIFDSILVQSDLQIAKSICEFLAILVKPRLWVQGLNDQQLLAVFVFAYIWGAGAALAARMKFSDYVKQQLTSSIDLPLNDTVFDYYLANRRFTPWVRLSGEHKQPFEGNSIIVPTPTVIAYDYVLSLLLGRLSPALIVGNTGTGKTSAVNYFLWRQRRKLDAVFMNFSAQTSSLSVQRTIEGRLERKSKNVYSAHGTKQLGLFIDDLNMPAAEETGAQPSVELLRQFVNHGGFYNRQKLEWESVVQCMLVGCIAPPGGGRKQLSTRFTQQFTVLNMAEPGLSTLTKIYGSTLMSYFDSSFAESLTKRFDSVVLSTVQLYLKIGKTLKPTPKKFHYVFNLRDVSRVFNGLMSASPRTIPNPEMLIKLWLHECSRVFGDRLSDRDDIEWFQQTVRDQLVRSHGFTWSVEDIFERKPILFTDCLTLETNEPELQFVSDYELLKAELEKRLRSYNSRGHGLVALVLFKEALGHVLRILRVLRQPQGNMMLVGLNGTGKRSLTRFASFVALGETYEIELIRNYGAEMFREDLRKALTLAGVGRKLVTFMLPDSHIVLESFLEDVSNLLNFGEIPGLFQLNDYDQLIVNLRNANPDSELDEEELYAQFTKDARENLHFVLCMSPVGDALKVRCRLFPSLINCTTMNWFKEWPAEALQSVAKLLLQGEDLSDSSRLDIAALSTDIHTDVHTAAESFFQQLQRNIYITPSAFLCFLNDFKEFLKKLRASKLGDAERLKSGIRNIKHTRHTVNSLRNELHRMGPELENQKEQTARYYEEVKIKRKQAEGLRKVVEAERDSTNKKLQQCKTEASKAQDDLAQAIPALEKAQKAVEALSQKAITELKAMKQPPSAVKMVLEAVCVLLNEPTEWSAVLAIFSRSDILDRLKSYDKKKIPRNILARLQLYIQKPDFDPTIMASKSLPAQSLCTWVIGINQYSKAYELIKPRQEHVKELKAKLKADMEHLRAKEAELNQAQQQVEHLENECVNSKKLIEELEINTKATRERLARAELLLSLFQEESARWEQTVEEMNNESQFLLGNCFLSAAVVSYLGPFTREFRNTLLTGWQRALSQRGFLCTPDFSVQKALASPLLVLQWNVHGLPTDPLSIENAVIATNSRRWPLLIDPEGQGMGWIKAVERKEGIKVFKLREFDEKAKLMFLRELKSCLLNGRPVLIEDTHTRVDPLFENLFSRNFNVSSDGTMTVRMGEEHVDMKPEFRLYLATTEGNPNFSPDIFIQLTVINFTVSAQGLEEQLLGEIVKLEDRKLEQNKQEIITHTAEDNLKLEGLRASILETISKGAEQILDDSMLIEEMQQSRGMSKSIQKRVLDSADLTQKIDRSRERYREIAERGALLYFTVVELGKMNPMYQFSLDYIQSLIAKALRALPHTRDIPRKVKAALTSITLEVFTVVSRGIFAQHRLLFAFLIATRIQRSAGAVTEAAWSLLLKRGISVSTTLPPNPHPERLTAFAWDLINTVASTLPGLDAVVESVTENFSQWEEFIERPYTTVFTFVLNKFVRLILIRALCPEKLMSALQWYVEQTLGSEYMSFQQVTIAEMYKESTASSPMIFTVAPGVDPIYSILAFAKNLGLSDKLKTISLGQGQGIKAANEIARAMRLGTWVLLQNCHLAESWMPALEAVVIDLQEESKISPSFRLFLTSAAVSFFPKPVLAYSLKLVFENTHGLKASLSRFYSSPETSSLLTALSVPHWKHLLFGLTMFHGVIQERKKFGSLGFNKVYEFNDTDLLSSVDFLKRFLTKGDNIRWDALLYSIEVNYAGKISDKWDRDCLHAILKKYCNKDLLEPKHSFGPSQVYYVPEASTPEEYLTYIHTLPEEDLLEPFGLHENANVLYFSAQSEQVIAALVAMQPDQGKAQDRVNEVLLYAESHLPKPVSTAALHRSLLETPEPPLTTVLRHEIERFNTLLQVAAHSIEQLKQALSGEIAISDELEEVLEAFKHMQVPSLWGKYSFSPTKSLSLWLSQLRERLRFFVTWTQQGNPICYWMSAFYYPQGLVTAALQTYARMNCVPVDSLKFSFAIKDFDETEEIPRVADGIYVYGFYLEGARWNADERLVTEQELKEFACRLPVVHFLPSDELQPSPTDYVCPVYKTTARNEYIVSIVLPSETDPSVWTLRGTAVVCTRD